MDITPYLDDLEQRLDPAVEDQLESEWQQFLNGQFTGHVFKPKRIRQAPPTIQWPAIGINDALNDYELMLVRELAGVSGQLKNGGGAMLNIRSNYGVAILPCVFGCEPFYMSDEQNTLPMATPVAGGEKAIEALVAKGVPDFMNIGWTPKVFECGRFYQNALAPYPKLKKYVRIYHPDLQGPLDAAEVVWGSEILLSFYDNPDLLTAFLNLVTETYTQFLKRWFAENPNPSDRLASHWGLAHHGNIMLRNDSVMNISGDMYEEYVMPFDQKLLKEFGGGAIHFCGKGSHYVEHLARLEKFTALNLSQPEYNDMEKIFKNSVDVGIPILSLAARGIPQDRDLHGLVHSW